MVLSASPTAACYCGCYATRVQLLEVVATAGAGQRLTLLASLAAFWRYLLEE